jgi:hypothetical protein
MALLTRGWPSVNVPELTPAPNPVASEITESTSFKFVQQTIQKVAIELYRHMKAVPMWQKEVRFSPGVQRTETLTT